MIIVCELAGSYAQLSTRRQSPAHRHDSGLFVVPTLPAEDQRLRPASAGPEVLRRHLEASA
ncbi:MAG: hypothetical protein ABJA82_09970 [Myxococcales bacterium]